MREGSLYGIGFFWLDSPSLSTKESLYDTQHQVLTKHFIFYVILKYILPPAVGVLERNSDFSYCKWKDSVRVPR